MNTIIIGQQHYRWDTSIHAWLQAVECTIYNIIDTVQELVIVMDGVDSTICTPQKVRGWIDFALNKGWGIEKRVYKVFEINQKNRITPLEYSLAEEAELAQLLATKFDKSLTSLEKSNIKYELNNLEEIINLKLPTVFKQLFLNLGNGNFGPDYGFFNLFEDSASRKITINEAYQDIQNANIKDWDWKLPQLFVPFLYWGADIYSIIDCSSPSGAIYVLDKNLKKEKSTWQSCVWLHCPTMMDWLKKWSESDMSGRSLWLEMYQIKGLI